ncbi:MAG: HisA/HisF-related TIM barrel protein, partial [Synergistaceae bacterium]|nr:HisA/HisF-related TIM barrel protein [Synergistaceae bacterium]
LEVLEKIASLGMFVQYGGGLRSEGSIRDALSAGANRVMIGSLLFKSSDMPCHIASEFGPAAMPAIDVKAGKVVHSGWLSETEMTPKEAIGWLRETGFSIFLVTNTDRDGMMSGTDPELYRELTKGMNDIVAAGGITTVNDILTLNDLGTAGVIVGKSLYEGGITISDALKAAAGKEI